MSVVRSVCPSVNLYLLVLTIVTKLHTNIHLHGKIRISLADSNTVVSAYTMYRHLRQYSSHPAISYMYFGAIHWQGAIGGHSSALVYIFPDFEVHFTANNLCIDRQDNTDCHLHKQFPSSPIAQSVAYKISEQEVADSIPGSVCIFFRGLMTLIATGFNLLSPLSIVSTMVMWESSQWKGYCADYSLTLSLIHHFEIVPNQ